MIEYFFTCPYCWQRISVLLDAGLPRFEGIEDCEVCCNPIEIRAEMDNGVVVLFRATKAQ
ncbi:CPXCG motif-containing cysteine-rich protein [Hydrogenimonas sp.]